MIYRSKALTGFGDGVLGYSKSGTGVYGRSSSGAGVYGISSTNDGGYFNGDSGDGVEAYGQNVALYAKSSKGEAANVEGTAYGLVASAQGDPLVLEDSNFNVVFQVDAHGNVKYKGSLFYTCKDRTRRTDDFVQCELDATDA